MTSAVVSGARRPQIHLNQRQLDALTAMGIQVWYTREPGVDIQPPVADDGAADEHTRSGQPVDGRHQAQAAQGKPQPDRDRATPAAAASMNADPEPASETAIEAAVEPAITLRFQWLRCGTALLMFHETQDNAAMLLLKDLVTYMAWRTAPGDSDTKLQAGQFTWPQLAQSAGTPAGALSIWMEKQQATQLNWLGANSELAAELQAWLPDGSRLLDIGELAPAIRDAQAKKDLWRRLSNNL